MFYNGFLLIKGAKKDVERLFAFEIWLIRTRILEGDELMTSTVSMVTQVLVLATIFLLFCAFREAILLYKYKKRERQFEQLKQICQYFIVYRVDPTEAEKCRGKDIVIEKEWLYTSNFFFNLKDDNAFHKLQAYYVELMRFFVQNQKRNDKETYRKILEFGNVLNILA